MAELLNSLGEQKIAWKSQQLTANVKNMVFRGLGVCLLFLHPPGGVMYWVWLFRVVGPQSIILTQVTEPVR